MLRLGLLLAAAYAYGHDDFRGMRPEALDLPIVQFHEDVNEAVELVSDPLGTGFILSGIPDPMRQLTAALRSPGH
jgi:hypothetical protein